MLFNKNKRADSKFRFQNSRFRRQLKEARGYKRPVRKIPQTSWAVFLSKIGLGSWLTRVIILVLFLLLIYIVYIPNIFFIKNISIINSDPQSLASSQAVVNSFLNKKLPLPQKNILFLSKNSLKDYLLKTNHQVLSVNKITKKFPNSLVLDLSPRVDAFALEVPDFEYYTVSNDGIVTNKGYQNASTSLPSNLILIKLTNKSNFQTGQSIIPQNVASFITGLQNKLSGITQSKPEYYEVPDFQIPDVSVYLAGGEKVIFDGNSNLEQSLNRLSTLFKQLTQAEVKKLAYIDMRFSDRGYVCYKDAPCALPTVFPSSTASSTPTNP